MRLAAILIIVCTIGAGLALGAKAKASIQAYADQITITTQGEAK